MAISRQLAYYYRKGKALRQSKANVKHVKQNIISEPHIPKPSSLSIRLHRLQRTYKILNAVSEDKLKSLKINNLNNNKQYIGVGFRITTQHLEIEGLEISSDKRVSIAILEGIAYSIADNAAKRLAEQYGLTIDLKGETPIKLTELEFVGHPSSSKVEDKGIIELYKDKDGYSIWTDKSFGLGGLESNKVEYLQRLTDFANDMGNYNAWQNMKETMELVVQEQKLQQEFFIKHNSMIQEITELIAELRKERKKD